LHVARDAVGTFLYGRGSRADSHISIGISSGGWHLGGFKHITTASSGSVGVANGTQDWARQITSRFLYARYKHERWTVDPVSGALIRCGTSQTIEPKLWLGNYELGADLSSYLHLCRTKFSGTALPYGPNGFFDRSSYKLHTWSAAATVGLGIGGLTLKAWSGASQWVQYHYTFGVAFKEHWLCGYDNYPLYASRIFAGG
jgi:hypothetical protein